VIHARACCLQATVGKRRHPLNLKEGDGSSKTTLELKVTHQQGTSQMRERSCRWQFGASMLTGSQFLTSNMGDM
jgi:hypothetical protein